jgi:transcription elongation factor Elf1
VQPELIERRSRTGRKPCPFCGSIDLVLVTFGKDDKPLLLQCKSCGATGPNPNGTTIDEEQLAALWDLRAKDV